MKQNLTGGKEESVAEVPPLFETRIGKRTWVKRTAGGQRTASPRVKSLKHLENPVAYQRRDDLGMNKEPEAGRVLSKIIALARGLPIARLELQAYLTCLYVGSGYRWTLLSSAL